MSGDAGHVQRKILGKLDEPDREGVYIGPDVRFEFGLDYRRVRSAARRLILRGLLVEYAPWFYRRPKHAEAG